MTKNGFVEIYAIKDGRNRWSVVIKYNLTVVSMIKKKVPQCLKLILKIAKAFQIVYYTKKPNLKKIGIFLLH
jgi:hypothetical protein